MSRVGSAAIKITPGVVCANENGQFVIKKNNDVKFRLDLPTFIKCDLSDEEIRLNASLDDSSSAKIQKKRSSIWGTLRAKIASVINGITNGFAQNVELSGTGYKANYDKLSSMLVLSLGYSHDIYVAVPKAIVINLLKPNLLEIKSESKDDLGSFVARLVELRKVEPYKLKGVKPVGRRYVKKSGKKK